MKVSLHELKDHINVLELPRLGGSMMCLISTISASMQKSLDPY